LAGSPYARKPTVVECTVVVAHPCALAFYGRGLAKRAGGDVAGGDADIARARQFDPTVAD
jgi:hypothetical protein